jgi:hypothetical protein
MVELLKIIAAGLTMFHFLGLWGSLAVVGVVVAIVVGLYYNGERLFEWLIHYHTRAIGKVLKGATVTVHSITAAPEPDPSVWRTGDDEEDDAFEEQLEASGMPDGVYEWYKIDATIEPVVAATAPGAETPSWEPAMIQLRKNDGESRHALELDTDCLVAQVEVWQDDQFVALDYGVVTGPGRIRIYVGVVPGTQDVQLSYLGELFADLHLPSRSRVMA